MNFFGRRPKGGGQASIFKKGGACYERGGFFKKGGLGRFHILKRNNCLIMSFSSVFVDDSSIHYHIESEFIYKYTISYIIK